MTPAGRPGFRLHRLEIRNWGTFHRRVWTFQLSGETSLLTGDIGSGKSTLVDALTTLLVPAHRVSYNKAAGAESKERTLRSYVLGHYKAERVESTGSSRPVALRGAGSYSVILGVFRNEGYGSEVSLAQVFWTKDSSAGQPERFFVTAERELAIATDFAEFGDDIATLKRRLRAAGAVLRDHFPEYGRDYRRRLGIESEQAMELFHQTVSMKSVGNLNEFVRGHMLEPFDAKEWVTRLVSHFEDLTKAHDAVVTARTQLADLEPLLADCAAWDELGDQIAALAAEREALPYFCADRKAQLLERVTADLDRGRDRHAAELKDVTGELGEQRGRHQALILERAGHGGDRLGELERRIAEQEQVLDGRRSKAGRFGELLAEAGLAPVQHADQFAARRLEAEAAAARSRDELATLQNRALELAVEQKERDHEAGELNAELRSLRSRRSSIPTERLRLREWLCRETGVPEDAVPFAGELISVRPEWSAWEGAAERLLRGFALSLLVPDEHYRDVSGWINEHHLGARLVYYRVPRMVVPEPPATGDAQRLLFRRLEIKDSPLYPWLERELARRAGYECVETMDEFRRAARAITMTGQVKGAGGRHEKDDRARIDDRSSYVLGWSNQRKIGALLERAAAVQRRLTGLATETEAVRTRTATVTARDTALAKLTEFRDFSELDWPGTVRTIGQLTDEKRRIEAASSELSRLATEIEAAEKRVRQLEQEQARLQGTLGELRGRLEAARTDLERARRVIAGPGYALARPAFDRLAGRIGSPATPAAVDQAQSELTASLSNLITARTGLQTAAANRAVAKMSHFRQRHPVAAAELVPAVEAAEEYRALHLRLVGDDLPRFEAQFKAYLNTNTIRDIAGFQGQLNKQLELIKQRIATINESLEAIDYNPGRYIRLEHHPTPNVEVRDFRAELRACTDSAVSGAESEQYSEHKFLQVKRIIERFRGRGGHTEIDRAWAGRVTDVRNWYTFSASERWREDNSEHENYTDSGGKSGGQKEKLAYTILAASLAYQFKLEWDVTRSKTFRFAVIDEAFGRGSDESTRYALDLFGRLGLQLLIVTPLQKIHVIEPYVATVGYVDNTREGDYSRLQTLSIEEYRELQLAHAVRRVQTSLPVEAS